MGFSAETASCWSRDDVVTGDSSRRRAELSDRSLVPASVHPAHSHSTARRLRRSVSRLLRTRTGSGRTRPTQHARQGSRRHWEVAPRARSWSQPFMRLLLAQPGETRLPPRAPSPGPALHARVAVDSRLSPETGQRAPILRGPEAWCRRQTPKCTAASRTRRSLLSGKLSEDSQRGRPSKGKSEEEPITCVRPRAGPKEKSCRRRSHLCQKVCVGGWGDGRERQRHTETSTHAHRKRGQGSQMSQRGRGHRSRAGTGTRKSVWVPKTWCSADARKRRRAG